MAEQLIIYKAELSAIRAERTTVTTYYLVTVYTDEGKACYTKIDSLEKAIQLCKKADFARIQRKLSGHARTKVIYEKYNGVVTTY